MEVKYHNFSSYNATLENRIKAVTQIASICYANPKALNNVNLYNRLETESMGLPSSSFEFVPVLLNANQINNILNDSLIETKIPHILKYGYKVREYILTNLRAVINDIGVEKSKLLLNKEEKEIEIIKDNFFVFYHYIDIPTRTQMIRHRASYQELSRRYVDDKREPIEIYIPDDLKSMVREDFKRKSIQRYNKLRENGIKKQYARYILPQGTMTKIWSAWQRDQLKNFFKLRISEHAQPEIRNMATEMRKQLLEQNIKI